MGRLTMRIVGAILLSLGISTPALAGSVAHAPERICCDYGAPDVDDFMLFLQKEGQLKPDKPAQGEPVDADDDAAIASLQKVLAKMDEHHSKRPRLLRKLAQLYGRRALNAWAEEVKRVRNRLATVNLGEKLEGDTDADQKAAIDAAHDSIRTYRELFDMNPRFAAEAKPQLELAFMLMLAGDDNAQLYFDRIQKEHADSAEAAWAALGAGEYWFSKKAQDKAVVAFSAAVKAGVRPVKDYAMLKLAWEKMFAKGGAQGGGDDVERLLKAVAGGKTKFAAQAARNDLAYYWAERNNADAAKTYFLKHKSRDLYGATLERIGTKAQNAGKTADAIVAYETLLSEAPARAGNFIVYDKLATLLAAGGLKDRLAATLVAMKRDFMTDSPWRNKHARDHLLAGRAQDVTLRDMSRFGLMQYQDYQKTKDDASLKASLIILDAYVAVAPQDEQGTTVRFFYAEALGKAARHEASAEQYHQVALAKAATATQQEQAAERMLDQQLAAAAAETGESTTMPPAKAKLVQLIDVYAKLFPAKQRASDMRLLAAQIEVTYHRLDAAEKRLTQLVSEAPQGGVGIKGARLLIGIYTQAQRWDDLIATARTLLAAQKVEADKPLTQQLRGGLRTGMWSRADSLAHSPGKELAAAGAYLDFQHEFPKDKDAHNAVYFAYEIYQAAGRGADGTRAAELLITQYPESTHQADVEFQVAAVHQQMLDFDGEGRAYQRFALDHKQDGRAAAALAKAAVAFRRAQNLDTSAALLSQLLAEYPAAPETKGAWLDLAKAREGLGDAKRAIEAYSKVAKGAGGASEEDALFAQAKVAVLTAGRTGSYAGLENGALAQKLAALPASRGATARHVLAEAVFDSHQSGMEALAEAQPVAGTVTRFNEGDRKVQAMVKSAESLVNAIVKIGDPEYAVAAETTLIDSCDKVARAYRELNNSDLIDSEREQVESLRERSILALQNLIDRHLESATRSAKALSRNNRWREMADREVRAFHPGASVNGDEQVLQPTYLSLRVSAAAKASAQDQ